MRTALFVMLPTRVATSTALYVSVQGLAKFPMVMERGCEREKPKCWCELTPQASTPKQTCFAVTPHFSPNPRWSADTGRWLSNVKRLYFMRSSSRLQSTARDDSFCWAVYRTSVTDFRSFGATACFPGLSLAGPSPSPDPWASQISKTSTRPLSTCAGLRTRTAYSRGRRWLSPRTVWSAWTDAAIAIALLERPLCIYKRRARVRSTGSHWR